MEFSKFTFLKDHNFIIINADDIDTSTYCCAECNLKIKISFEYIHFFLGKMPNSSEKHFGKMLDYMADCIYNIKNKTMIKQRYYPFPLSCSEMIIKNIIE